MASTQQALAVRRSEASPVVEIITVLKELGVETVRPFIAELVRQQTEAAIFQQDERLAASFALSGFFADLTKANEAEGIAQAMTKIQIGRGWHMIPADSMRYIDFINGRPIVENEYLASCMKNAGLDWQIQWHKEAGTKRITGCTLWPKRQQNDGSWATLKEIEVVDGKVTEVDASVSFTKADADNIRVKDNNVFVALSEKSTYKAYPGNMYYWRAVANLRRFYATNVLSGVLIREEIDDVEVQRSTPPPPAAPPPVAKEIGLVEPAAEARRRGRPSNPPRTDKGAPTVPTEAPAPAAAAAPAPAQQSEAPPQQEQMNLQQGEVGKGQVSEPTAGPAAPTPINEEFEQLRKDIYDLRDKAEYTGNGLFAVWMNDCDPTITTPAQLWALPLNELREHRDWLRMRASKRWVQKQTGEWVTSAF